MCFTDNVLHTQTNGYLDEMSSHRCPPLDNLINLSRAPSSRHHLKWVQSEALDFEAFSFNTHKILDYQPMKSRILLLIGSKTECTQKFIDEFSRIYSLPTVQYDSQPFNFGNFRRYSTLLIRRNRLIEGFTELDNNFYMVIKKKFYDCYSLYDFCSVCGILRCSPVWCICGHRELSNKWTSDNERLDKFIRDSQQTEFANDAYLEWIPFDSLKRCSTNGYDDLFIIADGLPTYNYLTLILLEISEEINGRYYTKVGRLQNIYNR